MTNLVEKTYWRFGKWYCGRRWISYNEVEHSYGFLKKVYVVWEIAL